MYVYDLGFQSDDHNVLSPEYESLMRALSRHGTVRDLLLDRHDGKHVTTRPPRLRFPHQVRVVI